MNPILKETLEILMSPLPLAALLGAAAALCHWGRRPKPGRWLAASAVMIAYLAASPIMGNVLIGPLERAYPAIPEGAPMPNVGYIVVLGAGYTPRDGVPVTAALNQEGLVRVVEGIRLMRVLGIAKLVLSGGAPPGIGRSARGYEMLARDLGVPASSLIILDESLDTAAEARAVRNTLGDASFILVTSAAHMPRAMRLMERAGNHPIPAPTGQLAVDSPFRWTLLVPNSGGQRKVEAALHEYLGLAALTLGIQ